MWYNSLPINNCPLPRCLMYFCLHISTFRVNHIMTPTPMNYIELTNPYFDFYLQNTRRYICNLIRCWFVCANAHCTEVWHYFIPSLCNLERGSIRNDDSLCCSPSNRTQGVDKYHKMDTRPWLNFMSKNFVLLQTLGIKW